LGALKGELHHNDIIARVEAVELAVHIGERRSVDFDYVSERLAAVGDAGRHVGKRPVLREGVDPAWDVFDLGRDPATSQIEVRPPALRCYRQGIAEVDGRAAYRDAT